jgi:hypothetical protein
MNAFKAGAAALALWSFFSPFARGEAPQPDRVRALVRQLDDDRFPVRRDAEQALRGLDVEALPLLKEEMRGTESPEVRRRLTAVIASLSQLHWQHQLDVALRQASDTGKPLLVFSSAGLPSAPSSLEAAAMHQRTFNDLKLIAYLNANFVVVWHDPRPGEIRLHQAAVQFTQEQIQQSKEGVGDAVHTFMCAPDGCVLQHLTGFQTAEGLLKAAARTPELAKGPRPKPEPTKAAAAQQEELLQMDVQVGQQLQVQVLQQQVDHGGMKRVRRLAPLVNPVGKHVWDVAVELERSFRQRLYLGC